MKKPTNDELWGSSNKFTEAESKGDYLSFTKMLHDVPTKKFAGEGGSYQAGWDQSEKDRRNDEYNVPLVAYKKYGAELGFDLELWKNGYIASTRAYLKSLGMGGNVDDYEISGLGDTDLTDPFTSPGALGNPSYRNDEGYSDRPTKKFAIVSMIWNDEWEAGYAAALQTSTDSRSLGEKWREYAYGDDELSSMHPDSPERKERLLAYEKGWIEGIRVVMDRGFSDRPTKKFAYKAIDPRQAHDVYRLSHELRELEAELDNLSAVMDGAGPSMNASWRNNMKRKANVLRAKMKGAMAKIVALSGSTEDEVWASLSERPTKKFGQGEPVRSGNIGYWTVPNTSFVPGLGGWYFHFLSGKGPMGVFGPYDSKNELFAAANKIEGQNFPTGNLSDRPTKKFWDMDSVRFTKDSSPVGERGWFYEIVGKTSWPASFGPFKTKQAAVADAQARVSDPNFHHEAPTKKFDSKGRDFDSWYYAVDKIIGAKYGVGVDDLPDREWRSLYEDGYSPFEAVRELAGDMAQAFDGFSDRPTKKFAATEFAVWGIPTGSTDEQLLISDVPSYEVALAKLEVIRSKGMATALRIQSLDLGAPDDYAQEWSDTISNQGGFSDRPTKKFAGTKALPTRTVELMNLYDYLNTVSRSKSVPLAQEYGYEGKYDGDRSGVDELLSHLKSRLAQENLGPEPSDLFTEVDDEDYIELDAPPGKEKQVRALKKDKDVDNPYAVAWAEYNKNHSETMTVKL